MKRTANIDFSEIINAQDYNDAIEEAKDLVSTFVGNKPGWRELAAKLNEIFIPRDGILPDDGRILVVNAYMSNIPNPKDTKMTKNKYDEIERIVAFGETLRKEINKDAYQDPNEWWLDIGEKIMDDFKGSPDLFPFYHFEWDRIRLMMTMIMVLTGEDWMLAEADRKLLVDAGPMILWSWWVQADTPIITQDYNYWKENILPTLLTQAQT
jgi:hypothetical protein